MHRYSLWIYLKSEIRPEFAEDEEKKGVESMVRYCEAATAEEESMGSQKSSY